MLPIGQRQQTRTRRMLLHDAGLVGAVGVVVPFAQPIFRSRHCVVFNMFSAFGVLETPMLHARVSLRTWSLTQLAEKNQHDGAAMRPQDRGSGIKRCCPGYPRRDHSPEAKNGAGLVGRLVYNEGIPFTFDVRWSDRGREGGKTKRRRVGFARVRQQRQANCERAIALNL